MGEIFTLVTVMVSGLFGLAVAIATSLLNSKIQNASYKRDFQNKKVESITSLYVEALSNLDFLLHTKGKVSDEDVLSFLNLKAKVDLFAAPEVSNLYFKAAEQLDAYNDLMRKAYKEGPPGVTTITQQSSKLSDAAQKHLEQLFQELDLLKEKMRKHINLLENQGSKV